jgi:hypothetical protein
MDELIEKAIERGEQQAARVLEVRSSALEERVTQTAAVTELAEETPDEEATTLDADLVRAAGGTVSRGVIVAEGDSWFDYPWYDILGFLEDDHFYDVRSVAHMGDTVEDMAYSGGQLANFSRELEKLIRQSQIPKAILLSGGGNDVAGLEFQTLLNHKSSPVPGLNQQVVSGIVDERVRFAYVTIISAVTRVCEKWAGRKLPILVHGYDYPVPDGRGYLGGFSFLPGPWLEPGFRVKDYRLLDDRRTLARELIMRFNGMLEKLPAESGYSHVRYVNLLGTLSNKDADYKLWWDNELHPTTMGFKTVTNKIAAALRKLS